ncbi:MAG: peptidoglycan-associated lipoprotein Pal [Deltaproteobacteria bacterium]|nr:peptidoglycan-associated lipoprotein Pal [Deltaproteobacteria bacterium]
MRKKTIGNLAVLILVSAGLMFMVSCAQTEVQSTSPDAPQVEVTKEDVIEVDDLAKQEALEEEILERERAASKNMFINEDIYFDYDDSSLKDIDREILKRKAAWLNNNLDASIVIEGHCDERGTTEYNLALGDRRAESARSFLIDLGINPARLEKISYGEEMPVNPGHDEEAWAKNRRAHLTIK